MADETTRDYFMLPIILLHTNASYGDSMRCCVNLLHFIIIIQREDDALPIDALIALELLLSGYQVCACSDRIDDQVWGLIVCGCN